MEKRSENNGKWIHRLLRLVGLGVLILLFHRAMMPASADELCEKHTYGYTVSGNKITATCQVCQHEESAWIEIEGLEENGQSAEFYFCTMASGISLEKSEGWDSSLPFVRLVFTSPAGKTTYNTMPTDAAQFGTVYLQVYTKVRTKINSLAVTEPVNLKVNAHDWKYSVDGYTMNADCACCDAHASVTLDADGVYTLNQTVEENDLSGMEYEIFIDNGWLEQEGIETFYILYDGLYAKEDYKEGIKCKTFKRPTSPGNYQASIALVTDSLDPETVYLKTDSISYYIATIPLSECEIKQYSVAQLNSFLCPFLSADGYYQVSTLEELLAVINRQETNVKVELKADIVMNPITVDEEGNVLCGTYTVYEWIPFGCVINKNGNDYTLSSYSGQITATSKRSIYIKGNGHTIYGLYSHSNLKYTGLVAACSGGEIQDLTLENCVFNAQTYAGAFLGYRFCNDYSELLSLDNLKAIHCSVSSSCDAGGIVGNINGTRSNITDDINNCFSDSYVNAQAYAGGIVGEIYNLGKFILTNCINKGKVQGICGAGGALGLCYAVSHIEMGSNVNLGSVSASNSVGGIVGDVIDYNAYFAFSSNISLGKLSVATYTGGLIGNFTAPTASRYTVITGNYYSRIRTAVGKMSIWNGDPISVSNPGTKLADTTDASYICGLSYKDHLSSGHWETIAASGCETEGEQVKYCLVCNEVLEERTIPAHGHQYEYGTCNFCGETGASQTGSVFTAGTLFAIPVAATLIFALFATVIIKNKRKKAVKAGKKPEIEAEKDIQ